MIIVRYADDVIVGFEREDDARRFLGEMRARLEEFALSLHPDKTRLIEFGRTRRPTASSVGSANRRPLRSWGLRSSAENRVNGTSSFKGRPAAACGRDSRTSRWN
ncbi:hypothetical protein [Mesorhizobium sp. M0816]|uniref:hypothetical protein n=1 Tax=Mesorhizobium sp. M0816 TaxID=2957006 RepID=UPI003336EDB0